MDSSELALSPEHIQEQMGEKDQLIQALTGRLEEAAEQLDRIRRNGSDRGIRMSGGASSEFQEQQQTVIESLSATVEKWEEIQPRDAFDRLELRLDNLRSLMESALDTGVAFGGTSPNPATPTTRESRVPAPSAETTTEEEAEPKEDALAGWEAMKAQLMSGGDATPPVSSSPSTPVSTSTETTPPVASPPATQVTAAVEANSFTPTPTEDVAAPAPVMFEIADENDLKQAIEERDAFIGYLTRRLRSEEQRTRQTIDWETLNNAPDDLKETLQGLEADLMERLRIAEVDLSLERARLSRIKANVEATQRQVEQRMMEQASKRPAASAKPAENPPSKDDTKPKGWLRSLGLN